MTTKISVVLAALLLVAASGTYYVWSSNIERPDNKPQVISPTSTTIDSLVDIESLEQASSDTASAGPVESKDPADFIAKPPGSSAVECLTPVDFSALPPGTSAIESASPITAVTYNETAFQQAIEPEVRLPMPID